MKKKRRQTNKRTNTQIDENTINQWIKQMNLYASPCVRSDVGIPENLPNLRFKKKANMF